MSIPPRFIPAELYDKYTMNNSIAIFDWYIDERKPVDIRQTLIWSNEYIQSFIDRFTIENIISKTFGYEGYKDASLYHTEVLKKYKHSIYNKNVAVIGSQTPWIEAILINGGAKSVTTVDYNKPECNHSIIKTITYDDFCNSNELYDSIFSYSSIEHSGLGRYGDSLDPDGDITAINVIYNHLSDSGYLFLGIPVGCDALVWNAHRVYGPKRLKLLLHNFNEIEWIGLEKDYIHTCSPDNNGPTPIIVLKK